MNRPPDSRFHFTSRPDASLFLLFTSFFPSHPSMNEKKDNVSTTSVLVPDSIEDDSAVEVGLRTWLAVFSGLSRSLRLTRKLMTMIYRVYVCIHWLLPRNRRWILHHLVSPPSPSSLAACCTDARLQRRGRCRWGNIDHLAPQRIRSICSSSLRHHLLRLRRLRSSLHSSRWFHRRNLCASTSRHLVQR